MSHSCVCSSQTLRYIRMHIGKPLYMSFIYNRTEVWDSGRLVVFPVEIMVNNYSFRNIGSTVHITETQILIRIAYFIAKQGIMPLDVAGYSFRIRINEQFIGIEAMSVLRFIRPIYPVAI